MAISIPTDGYCEEADVERLTGKRYSDSTTPTSSDVDELIKETANKINGVLDAAGYAVPIASGTRSLSILQNLNAKCAAAQAETAVPGIVAVPPRAEMWSRECDNALDMIARGRMALPDAPASSDIATPASNQAPAGKFRLDSSGDEKGPVFTQGMKW